MVANPWLTGRVTPAVLTRKIDATQPTLLLDESDAAFGGNREYAETLRGVLNSGHRRGGKVSCCVGQGANIKYQDFSTFCPKAIAGIGTLPDTVSDRAIPIRLRRAIRDEKPERFRRRCMEADAANIREQIAKWCSAIGERLPSARPDLPERLTDRQQDGAEPLLAIADAAGGEWPHVTRQALAELFDQAERRDGSLGVQLLTDIKHLFEAYSVERLSSAELTDALVEIETSPWSELLQGRRLTTPTLARLLKPFDISPQCIRIGEKTPRGYLQEQFQDAFARYVRSEDSQPSPFSRGQTATVQQGPSDAVPSYAPKCNNDRDVAEKKRQKLNDNTVCCGVAPQQPWIGGITEEL